MPDSPQATATTRITVISKQLTMATNGHSSASVALITGGASGMGLSVTERLVELGWNVMIIDINEEGGQKVAARLGDQTTFVSSEKTCSGCYIHD